MSIYGHRFDNFILNSYLTESENLNSKQAEHVVKILNSKYLKDIKSIAKKELIKFKDLRRASFEFNYGFRYYDNKFICNLMAFNNYAYRQQNKSDEEIKRLLDNYVKDVKQFSIVFKTSVKKLNIKGLKIIVEDSSGFTTLSNFKKDVYKYFKEENSMPSNSLSIYLILEKKDIESIVPTEDQIKDSEAKIYTKIYIKFAQFINKPHKMDRSFNTSHLSDISHICNISSTKLNELISKNMSTIGKTVIINPKDFDEEKWAEGISKKLGECYIIDEFLSNTVYYSIPNKKLYWINREHNQCEDFFKEFPYTSKELEDIRYVLEYDMKTYKDLYEEAIAVRDLFKKVDKEKGFNIIE